MIHNLHIELRWTPFATLVLREIRRFLRVIIQTLVTPVVYTTLYLLIFGVSLGQSLNMGSLSYLAFLIPGLVMMSALNNAFQNSSSSIIAMKFSGELEDLRSTPMSELQIAVAFAVGGLVRGLLVGGITFIVGQVFYFVYEGVWLAVVHPAALVFFLVVGGLAFSFMGMAIALWARSVDQVSAVSAFVLLPLLYLGGVFFSLQSLSEAWQSVASLNPLLYLINGVRYGMVGITDVPPVHAAILSLIFLLVTYVVARVAMRAGSFQRW